MLRTDCPSCKCAITSPFLASAETMDCPNCGATFKVRDVCVSSGPYSIYREVLLRNIQKYVELLREARTELSELEKEGNDSKPFRESAKTVKVFMTRLKGLLEGCRDKLRVPGGGTPLECRIIEDEPFSGTLVNISTTGLCLREDGKKKKALHGRKVGIRLDAPEMDDPLTLRGTVVWETEEGLAGVMFEDLDEVTRKALERLVASRFEADEDIA